MGERVRVRGNLISFPLPLIARVCQYLGIFVINKFTHYTTEIGRH
jgi:hypothetical protein